MSKEDGGDYKYIGQLGCESVQWKASEIRWGKFESFLRDSHVCTRIAMICYKDVVEDMKNLKYVFETTNAAMGELQIVGEASGEIHAFIEHECSNNMRDVIHLLPSSQAEDLGERDDNDDGNEADVDESENDGDKRPREENEGDGRNDERFNDLFEEGAKTQKAKSQDEEEMAEEVKEAEESDEDYKRYELGDAGYPDTPVESDEEWEAWANKKISKEVNRIAAICCEDGCKWRVYCTVEVPMNKWMVKVFHMSHNHGNSRNEPLEDLQNKGKATRHGRTFHCSNCGQAGHIKSGCKNEVVFMEGPKNIQGRTCKNLDEVMPKRPTQQRKKKKTSLDISNSQLLQEDESSTPIPAASSAPEPSVSSNNTNPPLKKKRGRALKITKPSNISRGTSKLMSAFIYRPFDVFKDTGDQFKPPQ
ncbi:unnamed protein product [Thlaspi arvense]|uniref:CCHC-type domain-containing protein n=1 Tax=Thlaspi arvense TaxID=13288 RepID=A0AAU9RTU4_THLAR|nr:unnamed protein product [Thlaspi arvense]